MGSETPRFRKVINRAMRVCVIGFVGFPVLATWSGWEGLLVVAFGCLMFYLGCRMAFQFNNPSPVIWEEDPRYQKAQYRSLLVFGAIGTLILLGLSLLSSDWSGMLTWLGLIAAVMLPWLALVGLVALGWKIFEGLTRHRAKKDGTGLGVT